ncbi:MAG: hypothetical protein KAQ85_10135, partial [Thermodesulfovibrionia bacterium]|nr:hypothetical protein [Thermodesulfovibrionia bacterium]
MKKLIVLAILFCISIPLMSAENSEDKITFDFIYSSLKGFNVTKCRIFYPENSFLEEIKAKEG